MSSGSQARSGHSDSSSEDEARAPPSAFQSAQFHQPQLPPHLQNLDASGAPEDDISDDEERRDEANSTRAFRPAPLMPSRSPQSSESRYRTPMGGAFAMTPMTGVRVPSAQPRGVTTPSAFGQPPTPYNEQTYPPPPHDLSTFSSPHRPPSHPRPHPLEHLSPRTPAILALERATESMQEHLSALAERMDVLESHMASASVGSSFGLDYSNRGLGRNGNENTYHSIDFGLWSRAGAAFVHLLRRAATEPRSPVLLVLRRLILDASLVFALLGLLRVLWRRSGSRRKEILRALRVLWMAIVGTGGQQSHSRSVVSRGV